MYYNDICTKGKDEFKMKHMGKVHVLKYVLLLIVAIGVGVGGYEIGLSHTQNTKNYQISKSSKSNTDNNTSSVSQESSSDSTDEIVSQDSSSSNDENSLFYGGTFAGYHNVHELANNGYTVTSYLITREGMTAKQAHQFIRDNYDKLSGFLTSGEIQTMNEDNN